MRPASSSMAVAGRRGRSSTFPAWHGAARAAVVGAIGLVTATAVACAPVATTTVADGPMVDVGRLAIGAEAAVVSVDGHATQVGIDVMRAGGNAIDAAIAVGFALAVTHPQAGNIGGGGFMVLHLADENRYTTLDFREMAPGASDPQMYLGEDGRPVRGLNYVGWQAPGVPGTVAGFAKAHAQWGKLSWARLLRPAIRLAEEGFLVNPYLAASFARVAQTFQRFDGSAAAFLRDGRPYQAGDMLVQPDLAWSLRQIAEHGPSAFYEGEIADRIVAAMEANDGLITKEDLAAYVAHEREPIRGTYRGYEVISMPPPSSGGTILVEMLNMLETFDFTGLEPESPEVVHLLAETMRQAYLDRATHLGDADFADVPVERLISKTYGRELASSVPRDHARASADLGEMILVAAESPETTHYSVVDGSGNAVSLTYTIEAGFGAKVVAPGTGFLLNNEMGDFNAWPGVTDERGYIGTDANLIEPRKRPLSSMTPTILAREGRPVALIGSPGGKTIINTVLRVIVGLVDFEQGLVDAVATARVHHQWMPDRLSLEPTFDPATVERLRQMGHELGRSRLQGDAHCIYIYDDGARLAVADARRAGSAAAY